MKRLSRKFVPMLAHQVREYWPYYFAALLSLVFLHYTQSLVPMMAKELGDKLLGSKQSAESQGALYFVIIGLLIIVFRTLSRNLFFYPARLQQKEIRQEIFETLEIVHPRVYSQYTDGDIFQLTMGDINRVRGLVGFGFLQVCNMIIAFWIFIPKLMELNNKFIFALIPILIGVGIFMFFVYLTRPYQKKDTELMGVIQNFIIESYDAKRTIKNYHAEEAFLNLFNKHSKNELDIFFKSTIERIFGGPAVKFGMGLSLLAGAFIVWNDKMDATSLIFFSGFLFLILEPLMLLSWIGVIVSQGLVGWERLEKLWIDLHADFAPPLLNENTDSEFVVPFYDKTIAIPIPLHKITVLIGQTGAGKSWCMGEISNILWHQKRRFSYIHQVPYLYNDTISGNIFLGKDPSGPELAMAQELLALFGLDMLASNQEELLKLEVGENGKRLSGGQAKRVCLIRSLLADVDYILWDDPFSSVDLMLEDQILKKIKALKYFENKTIIFTSHRFSTIKHCDEIVYLTPEEGIVAAGETKKIIAQKGRVSEFFQKQMV